MLWSQILALIGVNVTLSGIMIGLFIMNRNDMNAYRDTASADRRDLLQISRNIEAEMRDFHGRLERQDAEFKAHLHYHSTIQERNRGK